MEQEASPSPPPRQKLSIYPAPDPEILLLDTPSALEAHIGTARRTLTTQYRTAHAEVQSLVSRWIGVENRVENRIKALLPPDERVLPGALYVAIAFLTGSILARRRSFPVRAVFPPVLAGTAAVYYLPKLSANVRAYASDLEDEYTPELARIHETGKAHTAMGWARAVDGTREVREKGKQGVLAAIEQVQGLTGLRIREALGVAKSMEEKAVGIVEEKIEEIEHKAEKRLEELERQVEAAAKERTV
ncbi:apolipo protein O-domain-containing protein [Roridomyces roridus]|uniref:MICOS complex subunit n=1 Tax=Roridomyces roridus TaxID=1738132 RepID=A0AAD7B5M5_9AGAR|nr:apolipo protein O-domain-containing protein [Roridomyces roridus]KAJ7612703.1 apolipo protein O-domain-containing protein [Roridomyces roridus]